MTVEPSVKAELPRSPVSEIAGRREPVARTSDALRALLGAYDATLASVRRLPPLVMIPVKPRHDGFASRLQVLPRPRWFLGHFTVSHIRRTLVALARRYRARAAVGGSNEAERRDQEAIALYLDSLPPPMSKVRLALVAGLVLTLGARLVAYAAVLWSHVLGNLPRSGDRQFDDYRKLAERVAGMVVPSESSVREALDALLRNRPEVLLFFTIAVASVAYLVLRVLVPSFRLKRMAFNLHPTFETDRHVTPASWSVQRSTGIYELERAVFGRLDDEPPRELPFDLAVGAIAMLLVVALGIQLVWISFVDYFTPSDLGTGVVLIALCGLRVAWLRRASQRRLGQAGAEHRPYWVRVRDGGSAIKVETPYRLLMASAFALVAGVGTALEEPLNHETDFISDGVVFVLMTVALFGFLWWYRVSRELKELGRARGIRLGRAPAFSALCVGIGWIGVIPPITNTWMFAVPALVAGFGLGRRVRRAQRMTESAHRLCRPWVVGVLALPVTLPFAAVYVQRRLNDLWAVAAERTASEPGTDPGPDISLAVRSVAVHSDCS